MNTYLHMGYRITEFESKDLRFLWWDRPKNEVPKNAFNLGFFGFYTADRLKYTLPGGNVCVDYADIGVQQKQDIIGWGGSVKDGKVRLSANQNGTTQFKNKLVTTIIIQPNNDIRFHECSSIPSDCKYAISGFPIIRDGVNVSYINTFKPQGWFDDILRGTYRNMIGEKQEKLYLISGKSSTYNLLNTEEVAKTLSSLKFNNLIGFDGGGSYISTVGAPILKTAENRRINTIGIIN